MIDSKTKIKPSVLSDIYNKANKTVHDEVKKTKPDKDKKNDVKTK